MVEMLAFKPLASSSLEPSYQDLTCSVELQALDFKILDGNLPHDFKILHGGSTPFLALGSQPDFLTSYSVGRSDLFLSPLSPQRYGLDRF